MAVDLFLKFDPKVEGEALSKDHKGEIDIQSFSFGVQQHSGVATGSGSGASKAAFSSISIQKQIDKASVPMFVACCAGKHYTSATIVCREAGGDSPVDYWKIEMKQVMIDNVAWSAMGGGEKPSETVSLSYGAITHTYTSQDEKGKAGSPILGGWDVRTNVKL